MATNLTPVTRKEKFLSAAVGETSTSDLPTPVTREEIYLNEIAQGGGGGGSGFTPTQAQLDAMNSGITAERVEELSGIEDTSDDYIEINGIRIYVSATAPTGTIPDGSVGIGF